ncbi:hypothetical protein PWT90_03731 [Aphanocladium album]|nr:hypothetical protein PWT90_03731 [Aphanocladium album]
MDGRPGKRKATVAPAATRVTMGWLGASSYRGDKSLLGRRIADHAPEIAEQEWTSRPAKGCATKVEQCSAATLKLPPSKQFRYVCWQYTSDN